MSGTTFSVPASCTGEAFPFGVAVSSLPQAWGYTIDAPAMLPSGSTHRHQSITGDVYAVATTTTRESA